MGGVIDLKDKHIKKFTYTHWTGSLLEVALDVELTCTRCWTGSLLEAESEMSPAKLTKAELGLEAELVVEMTLPRVVSVWWLPSGAPVFGGMGGIPLFDVVLGGSGQPPVNKVHLH